MTNTPCLEHGDRNCKTCYNRGERPAIGIRSEMKARRSVIPRRALVKATEMTLEERVNLKVLYPILDKEILGNKAKIGKEPLTLQELEFLIENRLESGE